MKAIAVYPGKADSAHITDVPRPAAAPFFLVAALAPGMPSADTTGS
ncbi:hypothetical protein ACIHFD_14330 [Nonomuraea sp. NPDC051941]